MSVPELFTQRYQARIESGELFAEDLYLHDYHALAENASERLWPEAEAQNAHISEEGALRVQVWRAIDAANGPHKVKDLLRRARRRMADSYLQARQPLLGARPTDLTRICDAEFDWLFGLDGVAPDEAPFLRSKWALAANLLVFDFVEVFFDLLPTDEQLDFSRDLNTRLQRGASRWYFQLGRWRRDDWPRDRDAPFDLILHSLKRQAEAALERRENAGAAADAPVPVEFDAEAASQSLETAARALWQADRLLSSDLLSDKVRHNAAVRAARAAFDACLSSFGGVVRGPFVRGKPPRETRRGFGLRLKKTGEAEKDALKGVEEPLAAAIRLKRLSEALADGAHGVSREERLKLLERVNLAELLVRLALFGLPTDKSDPEEADAEEVRRYSRLTATEAQPVAAGKRLNHGAGTVHLLLEDKATARLAVDLMARLCQFATGAATSTLSEGDALAGLPEIARAHPRQADLARQRLLGRLALGAGLALGGLALLALGVAIGTVLPVAL